MFRLTDASTIHQSSDEPIAQTLTAQDWQTASASIRHAAQVSVLGCLVPPLELENQRNDQTLPFPARMRADGLIVYGPFMMAESLASSQLNDHSSDDRLAASVALLREAAALGPTPATRQAIKRILADFVLSG